MLSCVLILSACGASPEKAKDASPAQQAPAANTSIGPTGAAGITGAIPFTEEAVAAAAPLFILESGEDLAEGDQYFFIALKLADERVFTVYATSDRQRVSAVDTISTQARGPRNEVVGVTTFGDALATDVLYCRPPHPHELHDFSCSDAEEGRFWRAYELPDDYDGPTSPFESIDPDAATRAKLVRMTWIAPRS